MTVTQADVAALMQRVFDDELSALRKAGQAEYAGGENALGNFERLAALLGLSREQVLLVYLWKHLDGIAAWVKGHRSQREDVRGRINDAQVYLFLLRAMVEDGEAAAKPAKPAPEVQTYTLAGGDNCKVVIDQADPPPAAPDPEQATLEAANLAADALRNEPANDVTRFVERILNARAFEEQYDLTSILRRARDAHARGARLREFQAPSDLNTTVMPEQYDINKVAELMHKVPNSSASLRVLHKILQGNPAQVWGVQRLLDNARDSQRKKGKP